MWHFDESELKDIKPGPIAYMASHPVAANLLMIVFLVGGLWLLLNSKKEVFPQFNADAILIQMAYPGASPAEVEQGIILAIEEAIKDVDGIKNIQSSAFEGAGQVLAILHNANGMMQIFQDIKTGIDQISTFPVNAEDLTVSIVTDKQKVLDLVLYGTTSDIVLRQTAEKIQAELEQHPDIGIIDLSNVRVHEVHIEVSQESLRKYGLSIPDIAQIISATAIEIGGGSIKASAGEILVRMTERRDYAKDFKDIPIIKTESGSTIYLGNIATISDGFDSSSKYSSFNDKPAILMEVRSIGKQTPTGISSAVRNSIKDLNNSFPGDLQLIVTQDTSIVFQQRANLLMRNGFLGLVLVVIFLALFLDIRLAFWVSMGIPISYMGAFLLLPMTDGFSINMVSMFAFIIALGIVVDDAVVVGENIYHKREQGKKPLHASVEGAREMAIPVFVSVLTNIVAFLPMLFMTGFMGKIFSIIPIIVMSTFFLSLIESLFILPAHLTFKQAKSIKSRPLIKIVDFQKGFNRRFDAFVQNKYAPFLKKSLSMRYISLSLFLFVLITVGGYVKGGHLEMVRFPNVESDFSYTKATLKVGAPEKEVRQIENQIIDAAKGIIKNHGGEKLSVGIYSKIDGNIIEIQTLLTDVDTRPISTTEFTELWRKTTGDVLGVESISFSSNRGGPGGGAALSVELSHHDTDTLHDAARALAQSLKTFPNTQDINDGTAPGKRQFDFTVTDLGYTLGMTPIEIGRQIRGAFYGSEALKQQRGRNEVRVLVMSPEEERNSSYFVKNMMIKTPNGADVLLSDVVKMNEGRAYTTINRRNSRRIITIESDINPPSEENLITSALVEDTLPKLQERFPGLTYSFEGENAEMEESLESLKYGMGGILFVIYAILAILFSSYSQPLMIMIAIPFSMVGAVIGHFIMGFPMSIVSMFGIIALAGVVVNDSLILIDLSNRRHKEGHEKLTAVIMAATQRFRPIILTTLTTFIGLAPMMFETSRQARFLIPMAISLGYGIVFATFLTLILIPSLYMIIEDIKRILKYVVTKITG
ncbi:MAG: cobalt-zinc-cadmium resistance protein [Zetaproteobacteria bacterium]|nr:MAG: cobalt-zinc-cadmium resistance protein [Zetaproteobacteria bacterium]